MNESIVYCRNKIIHSLYKYILKPIFFRIDPENMHDQMTSLGIRLGSHSFARKITRGLFGYRNPILEQDVLGMHFENPVGLSAGFDKNAELLEILPAVGFGFVEVGSITGSPCAGNPKPRLWRLIKSKGLAVYYGLKNDGCDAISKKLQVRHSDVPLGISVAMTNCKENLDLDNAVNDYAKAFSVMESLGDYITINISCPNTEGGQPFIVAHRLDYLFDVLDKIQTQKPIFIKISPDMNQPQLDALLDVSRKHRIHGIITTNLTKKRDNPRILDEDPPKVGGLSGKVVQDISDETLSYIYRREGKRFILIGSGGVFTAKDAYKKIKLGASLVQIITSMVFEGPQVISEINQGLAVLLKKDGFININQAIGADNH